MRSKRSSAGVSNVDSFIGSVIVTGFDNGVHLAQSVARTAVHGGRVEFALFGEIPDGGFLYAEFGAYLLLGEKAVFLLFHEDGKKAFAGGFDCVNHQLMEVGEADGEENIGRVRTGCRCLKKVKKIQFHSGGNMNLKVYVA